MQTCITVCSDGQLSVEVSRLTPIQRLYSVTNDNYTNVIVQPFSHPYHHSHSNRLFVMYGFNLLLLHLKHIAQVWVIVVFFY